MALHVHPDAKAMAKRRRTRKALTDVAIQLFAERGIEETSILEITQRANVSNGAFYYHFGNKEELLVEVRGILAETMLDRLHEHVDKIDRPEKRIAFGIQWLMLETSRKPELGRILAEVLESTGPLQIGLVKRMRRDIQWGLSEGVFDVQQVRPLFAMLGRVAAVALRAGIEGADLRKTAQFVAEQQLRMLGVLPARARELARQAQDGLAFS
jgi:AcrR family transcriptional regulator